LGLQERIFFRERFTFIKKKSSVKARKDRSSSGKVKPNNSEDRHQAQGKAFREGGK